VEIGSEDRGVETGEWKQGSGDREWRQGVETWSGNRGVETGDWRHGVETGEWRKLRNVELHDFYCSLNVIGVMKEDELGWACSRCGGKERRIENFSEKYS